LGHALNAAVKIGFMSSRLMAVTIFFAENVIPNAAMLSNSCDGCMAAHSPMRCVNWAAMYPNLREIKQREPPQRQRSRSLFNSPTPNGAYGRRYS
jgi:hypothetical protein